MKIFLLALSLMCLGANCANLEYQKDSGFLNSAQANSPEFPVLINGIMCADYEKKPGMCSLRTTSVKDVALEIGPRPYSYTLSMRCTDEINENQSFSVAENQKFTHTITAEKFRSVRSFTCISSVSPSDRDNTISAEFEFRVKIVDARYQVREVPQIVKDRLIMGEHSKYVNVCDKNGCRTLEEKPVIKFKGSVSAFSESEMMRFNYYGTQ